MSSTVIRDCQPSDLEPLAELWFASWASTGLAFADGVSVAGNVIRIEAEIDNGWVVRVAVRDGQVIGFLAITPHEGRLNQLFVAPEAHGTGVGTKLLEDAKAKLPDGFWLWTPRANINATAFYTSRSLHLDRYEQDGETEMAIFSWR
ncbi:GNAT family N-acetyltransferase [Phenylobacterium sp.]|uniref:GNAT family N-acetyltransferase n=1 Tax=Phenylobacterium sp. TaxID=1871053 RepID=UPI0030F44589